MVTEILALDPLPCLDCLSASFAVDSISLFVGHIFYLLDKWAVPLLLLTLVFSNDHSDGLSARQSWDCLSTLWPLAMSLYIILISNNQGLGWWWMGWRAKMASARTLGAPPAPFPDWLRAPSRDWALGQSDFVIRCDNYPTIKLARDNLTRLSWLIPFNQ